jgi:hypothetical protein
MPLSSWWKCRIVSNDKIILEFNKGNIVFAKNGEEIITLFDGKKAVNIPKMHFTRIKLLSRLDKSHTAFVERHYQFKLKQVSQPSYAGDHAGQDTRGLDQSRINKVFAETLKSKETVVIKTQRKVGAWCKKVIQDGSQPITHGICPECAQKEIYSHWRQKKSNGLTSESPGALYWADCGNISI